MNKPPFVWGDISDFGKSRIAAQSRWATLKYRLRYSWGRFWRRRFPPRYFVATYGDMGLEVEFFRNADQYETACEEAEEQHALGNLDSYTHGDIVP